MQKTINILFPLFSLFILSASFAASQEQYSTNPYIFPVAEPVFGPNFFVADVNDDGAPDFIFRSETRMYAYDHDGITLLWSVRAPYDRTDYRFNHGTKMGAGNVDNDAGTEVVALIAQDSVIVINGATGALEKKLAVPGMLSEQYACHMALVQLNQSSRHELLIQTADYSHECHTTNCDGVTYYINRSLIAMDVRNETVLWQLDQNDNTEDDIYEGYWGQGHGPLFACDIDGDGEDEIIGGNLVESDGTVTDLGYPQDWIHVNTEQVYIDHLDGISVGDIRPDIPGIEWVVTEEDGNGYQSYNTTLMSAQGILWTEELSIFPEWASKAREPQHTAIGDYDLSIAYGEVWARSRLPDPDFPWGEYESQRPWILDACGTLLNNYKTGHTLPPNFNTSPTHGNNNGIENIWTIDWRGGRKEFIAAKSRYVEGPIGVFDAMSGDSVWTSMQRVPNLQCDMLYVADISGDIREEMIVYDTYDQTIKIFWNTEHNPNPPKPEKWQDPLYTRLKQNWNFYSPGSYTYTGYPEISNFHYTNVTPVSATIEWDTDLPADSQILYGETRDLGSSTDVDTNKVLQHAVTLDGLSLNTDYYVQIRTVNRAGKIAYSKDTLLTLIPLNPPTLTAIQKQHPTYAKLTWTPAQGITVYNVYRYTNPDFSVNISNRIAQEITDNDPGMPDIQWTDSSLAIGDPDKQYFYKITSVISVHESEPSNVLGEIDFALNATLTYDSTSQNVITLPYQTSQYSTANQLAGAIPNCNSIARWDISTQSYQQFIPGCCGTNFNIQTDRVFFVNITADTVFSLMGKIAEPNYDLIHNSTNTSYNDIFLPLDKYNLTTASDLANNITGCNGVVYWDAKTQSYLQYVPGNPFTDFTITPGQGYLVHMSANTSWPDGGAPKQQVARARNPEIENRSSTAPHVVWGWRNQLPGQQQIQDFKACLADHPDDILTSASSGCMLHSEYWLVQCASFSRAWSPGQQLQVDFLDRDQNSIARVSVPLTLSPADQAQTSVNIASSNLPEKYRLGQNYPNPFNTGTIIPFELPEKTEVSVTLWNTLGQKVRTLLNRELPTGIHELRWDGLDDRNQTMPGGIYLIKFQSSRFNEVKRMLYLK